MAIIQSPLGTIKGKFGTAVFSESYGKNTMRAYTDSVKNPNTLRQQMVRKQFSMKGKFASFLNNFVKKTFINDAADMPQHDKFLKINHQRGMITGEWPDFRINYPNLLVSKGILKRIAGGIISYMPGNKLIIHWNDNSNNKNSKPTDTVVILLINENQERTCMAYYEKTARNEKRIEIAVPRYWKNDKFHIYFSFRSAKEEVYSDSVYLGNVTLAGDGENAIIDARQHEDELITEPEPEKCEDRELENKYIETITGNKIVINWKDNQEVKDLIPNDIPLLLLENETINKVRYYTGNAGSKDHNMEITVPEEWAGDKIKVHLSFTNIERDKISDMSIFLGYFSINVMEESAFVATKPEKTTEYYQPEDNVNTDKEIEITVNSIAEKANIGTDAKIKQNDGGNLTDSELENLKFIILINETKNHVRYFAAEKNHRNPPEKIKIPEEWKDDKIKVCYSFEKEESDAEEVDLQRQFLNRCA
jgi:hypothetical protein